MIGPLLLLAAATAPAAAPSAEAEALGMRLARTGTLATLLPAMAAKETDEMVAAHPELSDAEQAKLREAAAETLRMNSDRIFTAQAHAYATTLSLPDLENLVAFAESEPARHLRASQPQIIDATMAVVAEVDFKGETMAAFCKKTGKGCARK